VSDKVTWYRLRSGRSGVRI